MSGVASSSRQGVQGGAQGKQGSSEKGKDSSSSTSSLAIIAPEARLARYSLTHTQVVLQLLEQLATIPEAFELARATGLTINQAVRHFLHFMTPPCLHTAATSSTIL